MGDAPATKITRGKKRVDFVGPYRLTSVLGSRGFGTVHAAEAPDGTNVAVKVLARRPRLLPIVKVAKSVRAHRDAILAALYAQLSNARLEWANIKIPCSPG